MTGAIEFLRKAKAICKSQPSELACQGCPISEWCLPPENIIDEADHVRKVMEYRLEDGDADN